MSETPVDALPLPWERQPDESDEAYYAFSRYLEMGAKHRSLPRLASEMIDDPTYEPKPGAPPRKGDREKPESLQRRLEGWSSRHRWRDRVHSWDAELDRRARDEQADAILEMRRRHAQLARLLQIGLTESARVFAQMLREAGEEGVLSKEDADALLDRMERAARVLPAIAQMERAARGDGLEPSDTPTPPAQDYTPGEAEMFEVWAALEEVGVDPRNYLASYIDKEEPDGDPPAD